jgi:hypothetical protein
MLTWWNASVADDKPLCKAEVVLSQKNSLFAPLYCKTLEANDVRVHPAHKESVYMVELAERVYILQRTSNYQSTEGKVVQVNASAATSLQ